MPRTRVQAVCDGQCLGVKPSVLAAAALYMARVRHGVLPLWPTAMAQLIGTPADLADSDLMAAVALMSA